MSDVQLRAQMLLAEAEALGVELADLVAAGKPSSLPTLAAFVESIAPTFADATYWPYWRLGIARFGDRPIAAIDLGDLHLVVADAVARAKKSRPKSTGRSSAETCVAALRAVFRRAHDAGLIRANPAAALPRPTRARSRRRALSDTELGELIDAVRTTSTDPHLDLLLAREERLRTRAARVADHDATDPVARRSARWRGRRRPGVLDQVRRPAHQSSLRRDLRPCPAAASVDGTDAGIGSRAAPHGDHRGRPSRWLSRRPGLRGPCPVGDHGPVLVRVDRGGRSGGSDVDRRATSSRARLGPSSSDWPLPGESVTTPTHGEAVVWSRERHQRRMGPCDRAPVA